MITDYFTELHPNTCSCKSIVRGYLVFPENTKNMLEKDIVKSVEKGKRVVVVHFTHVPGI